MEKGKRTREKEKTVNIDVDNANNIHIHTPLAPASSASLNINKLKKYILLLRRIRARYPDTELLILKSCHMLRVNCSAHYVNADYMTACQKRNTL